MPGNRPSPRAVRLVWNRREAPASPPAVLHLASDTRPTSRSAATGDVYLGDNLAVMRALMPALEGRIDLIYADPPFNTGRAFAARIGRGEDSRKPSDWKKAPGYGDRWEDPAAYLDMLAPRLEAMHRLLSPTGSLYLHVDWRASAHARVILDEIFGPDRLLNEIIWAYHGPSPIVSAFKRKHDTILVYTKSRRYRFDAEAVRVPYDSATVRAFASSPRAGFGKTPNLARGKVPEDWWYFPVVARLHNERTGYPTQKPLGLMQRMILASSRKGDLVADFFCGSGTTAVAAARAGRHWLLCDHSPLAIATVYRRLALEPSRPGFRLWTTRSRHGSATLGPHLRWRTRGRSVEVELQSEKIRGARTKVGAEINLWEVDWDSDGPFRSRSRSVRGWRSDALPGLLRHTFTRPGQFQVAVRAWDSLGRVHTARRRLTIR
ncbi:MAG TPA: DNA methyltransferase [Anaerolineales bacterium]|nr:DNA methyltransferase [Anaerolineales bacterium]